MRVLTDLEPKNVFSFFEDICSIPHPSYKEEKISNYLVEFAKARGLEHYQDELHNVIIIKEASEGYEDVEPIILQGHMDMVCEKAPDCDKDMDEVNSIESHWTDGSIIEHKAGLLPILVQKSRNYSINSTSSLLVSR